jgi:hypothetical protein
LLLAYPAALWPANHLHPIGLMSRSFDMVRYRTFKPQLESLEDRSVPAALTYTRLYRN